VELGDHPRKTRRLGRLGAPATDDELVARPGERPPPGHVPTILRDGRVKARGREPLSTQSAVPFSECNEASRKRTPEVLPCLTHSPDAHPPFHLLPDSSVYVCGPRP